jgi:glycosyltransferase involved in cell wall biosynthesis
LGCHDMNGPEHKTAVSVVIPTHNRAHYLEKSVMSVLTQKGDYELDVIVVDDGSTDNTEDVIKRFGGSIRYRKIEASGRPAVPRNVGIEMARSDLIAFLDSDDLWTKRKLEDQLPLFYANDAVLSYGNAEVIAHDGTRTGESVVHPGDGGTTFCDLLETNFISTLTVVVQRDALVDLGGFNEEVELTGVEDYELWLRLAAAGNRIHYADKTLSLYRRHDQGMSATDHLDALKALTAVYRSVLGSGLADPQATAARKRLHRLYLSRSAHSSGLERLKDLAIAKFHQTRATV